MIRTGIIGANGFLGLELLRILSIHPKVEISKILKRENEIEDEFTHLSSLNLNEIQIWCHPKAIGRKRHHAFIRQEPTTLHWSSGARAIEQHRLV